MYFDIFKTTAGSPQKYWWVAKGNNHETLCTSEMLTTKAGCVATITTIMKTAASANVYDETGEVSGDVNAKRISIR
jgi:uncharacterized protein YegP (UPF0339 family)